MADRYRIQRNGGGRFTAFEWDDGRWELDRPDRNEQFRLSKDGRTFSITEHDDGITTREVYTDTNRDGVFEYRRTEVVRRASRPSDGSYKVDRVTGGRLNVYEWDDGRWQLERPDRNEQFRLSRDGRTLRKLEFERNGTEINIYKDNNRDGIYEFVRTRFESSAGSQDIRNSFLNQEANPMLFGSGALA